MQASNLIEMNPNLNQVVFALHGGTISWKSSKHEATADFTTELEYIIPSDGS